jgi:NAD(P)-dependent dehydrogenase (short-subunit alcohol dehydrogenase family)
MKRVALITGGGRGFGRAFAVALAKKDWRVSVTSRTDDELEGTLGHVHGIGAQAIAVRADVTDARAVERVVAETEHRLGPIDLLVNNAGAGPPFGPFCETSAEDWWRNVEVNLKGPMLCCRAVLPGMVARGQGRIGNIASGAGTISIPYLSAYVTAKAAVIRFTEVLADELRPHGVSIFAIEPGTVRTAMAEQLLQSDAGKRWMPWFQQIFDEGRDITTEAAEELVLYLASGKADAQSGRFFQVGGTPDGVLRLCW